MAYEPYKTKLAALVAEMQETNKRLEDAICSFNNAVDENEAGSNDEEEHEADSNLASDLTDEKGNLDDALDNMTSALEEWTPKAPKAKR